MKKVSKKISSLILVVTLLVSLAGCGNTAKPEEEKTPLSSEADNEVDNSETAEAPAAEIDMEEDPYTVAIQVVTLPGTQFEGEKEREEAINAITVPAINCKVDIQEIWISEIANTTSMAVAGDEKIDLVHVATVNPLSSLVGSDILLDMNQDNLLQTRGKDIIALFGDLIETGYVNGQQLAIPAKTFNASAKGFMYNKTMADQYNITIPETATMDDIEKALYEIKEANGDVMPFFVGNGELNYLYWIQGYEGFGNQAAYGAVMDSARELKVENVYATDAFREHCLRMYQWRVDGIHPGDPTDTNSSQTYLAAEQLFMGVCDIHERNKAEYGAQAAFEYGYAELVGPKLTSSAITEYMWGIASNSERPDKAMDFLNFLYANDEIANILKYGLADVNYSFAEGSEKVVIPNGSYLPLFYYAGDMETMYIMAPAGEDYNVKNAAMEAVAEVSPICGYMFDDTDYRTESSVIYATIMEYLPRLQNGMCESEDATAALIDEFNEKLSASGMDDVVAANQQQLDAWLAAQ